MLTQTLVKELFDYDPSTGIFKYATSRGKVKRGEIAGGKHKSGAIYLRILGKKELAHRIAWLYIYGYLPVEIDHIDQNRGNNKLSNLRDVSHNINMKNKPKYKNNTTGVAGVSIDKRCGKYRAYININGKHKGLGYFTSLELAIAAREKALKANTEYHKNHGK